MRSTTTIATTTPRSASSFSSSASTALGQMTNVPRTRRDGPQERCAAPGLYAREVYWAALRRHREYDEGAPQERRNPRDRTEDDGRKNERGAMDPVAPGSGR